MKQLGSVLKDEDLAPGGHRDALEARLGGKGNRQASGTVQEADLGREAYGQELSTKRVQTKPFTKYQ